jgi:site-specific DNA recombinase
MWGATLLCSGFQALMRDALNRRFDVVLAESLDRFSREQEDTAGLFKRLTRRRQHRYARRRRHHASAHRVQRDDERAVPEGSGRQDASRTARARRGRQSAGGLCYGYRVVKLLGGGAVTTGEREIEPAKAAIVERIFREFRGKSCTESDSQATQSGWDRRTARRNVESQHDSRELERGTGILNNELYVRV